MLQEVLLYVELVEISLMLLCEKYMLSQNKT